MKRTLIAVAVATCSASIYLVAQQRPDFEGKVTAPGIPKIAIPDFRGSGEAQGLMNTFNSTLWNEIRQAGILELVGKSFYPLQVPQQPSDFKPPSMPTTPPRRGQTPQPVRNGPWLTDWSSPPVSANYLAFGYTAPREGQLVLFGWLYDVTQLQLASAQLIGKLYFGPMNEDGAKKVAREFAADIVQQFGGKSLMGTKIYFVSNRTGSKEIWAMDYDGSNQKQFTRYGSISSFPCVSPDGSKIAFLTYYQGNPKIFVHSADTGRKLPFYNQAASLTAPSDFTPDGKQLLLYMAPQRGFTHIYAANVDGSNLRPISPPELRSIEVEAKVNPKTGSDLVFVSGRGGMPQIYKMNIDGADIVRLTDGEGEAVNPSWSPDGQKIAFAWTKGFEPGHYNIFIMDVATRQLVQLTHGAGRNENPVWAPDGLHIVFSSTRAGSNQIFTMLADGTQIKQLTTHGSNDKPVWGKAGN